MLSVNTVKKIAREVAQTLPELKIHTFDAFAHTSPSSNAVIMEPTSNYKVAHCIMDTTNLALGPGAGQRIGDQIFVRGFRLAMAIRGPRFVNLDMTSAEGGQSTYIELHVRVVKLKSGGQLVVLPPRDSLNIAENIYESNFDKGITTREHTFENVFHKKYVIKPKVVEIGYDASGNPLADQSCQPTTIMLKKYIKINKKLRFTGSQDGDWKSNYFLWVYAYNVNNSLASGTTYWGGNANYCPRLNYSHTTYFTDA
jgi:hypothetical protein